MTRRFNYDDEDRDDEANNFFQNMEELTPEEYEAMINEQQAVQAAQIELVRQEFKQRLLGKSLKFLEKTFLWRFLPLNTKLRMLHTTYYVFEDMTSNTLEEQEQKLEEPKNEE